ncbi:MAG: NAD(P)H-dependent oxidoreductase [Melioribacteraceae bacterium]|nr:NAD(P)H-dependent oxidoreductase [Melioribacteraceae bacterium]MCF8353628.1 NAD(P)H-dependent oxidoreductase [Melioribacteraceae bacterium]MCF8393398.1 NAD(P)H-dependent oxidoreductase [Melioribacteraceae bacterium]MCF8419255.1 NAD(P)H-dependent oxidoreductase [Melioribacteraceae bacterium]
MKHKAAVIYGSVRSNRKGIKAAKFIVNKCKEHGFDATLIDPLEFDLPLIDKMYKEYKNNDAPPALQKLADILKSADGYIVVTGEYNHSIPPALSNLMDYFLEEYFFKPSAIVSYSAGRFGGVRAAMQMRAFLGEIGTTCIPSIFALPKVGSSFDDEGNPLDEAVNKRSKKFFDEFEWYIKALYEARKNGTPY